MKIKMSFPSGDSIAMQAVLDALRASEDRGRRRIDAFEELPPMRDLPDYYDVIKEPMALDMIELRRVGGEYQDIHPFLHDIARIFWNARHYNKAQSLIVKDVNALETVVVETLKDLQKRKVIGVATLPTVGPPTEEELKPSKRSLDEMEDDDDDDSVTGTPNKRVAGGARKRNRPPKVETPDETRMKNILRQLRRISEGKRMLYEAFDRLPDPKEYPDYYRTIARPISIEVVRKRYKRKEYNMSTFLDDLRRVFRNAQTYNEDSSQLYRDATSILKALEPIIEGELKKADDSFLNIDIHERIASTPLEKQKLAKKGVDAVLKDGESYRVGDWLYVRNLNDAKKPIIAQIFRTWQNADGSQWMNVCWYYRPEQTVHRADRPWLVREVVKTGQYRDTSVDDIIGRCYVMYITRYTKGRPVEFTGREEDIWVCEYRYHEETEVKNFTRIKSWKSCVPEEKRDACTTYEIRLFEKLYEPKKLASPLMHLMPRDKSKWVEVEGAPVPAEREQGKKDAPPKQGNIIVTGPPDLGSSTSALPTLTENTTKAATAVIKDGDRTPRESAHGETAPVTIKFVPMAPPAPAKTPTPAAPAPEAVASQAPAAPATAPTSTPAPKPAAAPKPPKSTTKSSSKSSSKAASKKAPPIPVPTPAPMPLPAAIPPPAGAYGYGSPAWQQGVRIPPSPSPYGHPHGIPPPRMASPLGAPLQAGSIGAQTSASSGLPIVWHIAQLAAGKLPPQTVGRLYSLGSGRHPTTYTLAGPTMERDLSDRFKQDDNGNVLWHITPPIDPVQPAGWEGMVQGHSAKYLAFKRRKEQASRQLMDGAA